MPTDMKKTMWKKDEIELDNVINNDGVTNYQVRGDLKILGIRDGE